MALPSADADGTGAHGASPAAPDDPWPTPAPSAPRLPRDAAPAPLRASVVPHPDDGATAQHPIPPAWQEPRPVAAGPARRTTRRADISAPWRPQAPGVPVRTGGPLSPHTVSLLADRDGPAAPAGIHISIDRIEVRAPVAPAPAATPARPRASDDAHSLRDYLQGKPSR